MGWSMARTSYLHVTLFRRLIPRRLILRLHQSPPRLEDVLLDGLRFILVVDFRVVCTTEWAIDPVSSISGGELPELTIIGWGRPYTSGIASLEYHGGSLRKKNSMIIVRQL
jgi:hypothetical protein